MTISVAPRDRCRDKALLIALRYECPERENVRPLKWTHYDMDRMLEHLVNDWHYLRENIITMRDGDENLSMRPTKENILREIATLVEGICPGDRRVFYFAGHCYQTVNRHGTESDNLDEAILVDGHHGPPISAEPNMPFDFAKVSRRKRRAIRRGLILDNELRKLLVDKIPVGAKLMAISDTCNSGTLLDLDYHWQGHGNRSKMKTLLQPRLQQAILRKRKRSDGECGVLSPAGGVWQREEVMHSAEDPIGFRSPQRRRSSKPSLAGENSWRELPHWVGDDSEVPCCSSPPPGPVPEVMSVSSSRDGQNTISNQNSMTADLIKIIKEQGENRITMSDLNYRLNIAMGKSRCQPMREKYTAERKPSADIRVMLEVIRRLQQPVIGALSRDAPSKRFSL